MKIHTHLKPLLSTILCLLSLVSVHADEAWKQLPKSCNWKGKVGIEDVEVTINAGEFARADHKVVEKDGMIESVDGVSVQFGGHDRSARQNLPPHITTFSVRWAGKEVAIPQGSFTSVFLPYLAGPELDFKSAKHNNKVWIGSSDDGTALLITMVCGYDALHVRLAFTISKDGRVHRFFLEGIS